MALQSQLETMLTARRNDPTQFGPEAAALASVAVVTAGSLVLQAIPFISALFVQK
jgi:hypothetical protein